MSQDFEDDDIEENEDTALDEGAVASHDELATIEAEIVEDDEQLEDEQPEDDFDVDDITPEEITEILEIGVSIATRGVFMLASLKLGDKMLLSEDEDARLSRIWTKVTRTSAPRFIKRILSNPIGAASFATFAIFIHKFLQPNEDKEKTEKE